MTRLLVTILLMSLAQPVLAEDTKDAGALQQSVGQLRDSVGEWDVVTEFLNDDGTTAKSVTGTYEFGWTVPDRVVSGRSDIPELQQSAGILFYINEKKRQIEMVSVGGDGALWIMTGPLGGEERLSQEFPTAGGGTARLRFTRFNISANSFESRMDWTDDGGKTWKPGNHQTFRRKTSPSQ